MSYYKLFKKLKNTYVIPSTSGLVETFLPKVRFFWSTEYVPRTPLPYSQGIIIIGQGHKVGYLDDRTFRYDDNNYLISSVPTSYECETFGSPEKPVLGLLIEIEHRRLIDMADKIFKHSPEQEIIKKQAFHGVEPIKISQDMRKAIEKLMTCLQSPMDSEVLGQSRIDEVVYRALLGGHGAALMALTHTDSYQARLAHVLNYLHQSFMTPLYVEQLAEMASMSVSSFHRAFKITTGDSPIQYVKKLRLNQARVLMSKEGIQVAKAADLVGYESVSQFSREFKRHFKVTPSKVQQATYAPMFNN